MSHQYKIFFDGASAQQKGEAAELRYSVDPELRRDLNQIVHSGDVAGPYSNTYNPYRDLTNSYDPKAQEVLDKAKKRS